MRYDRAAIAGGCGQVEQSNDDAVAFDGARRKSQEKFKIVGTNFGGNRTFRATAIAKKIHNARIACVVGQGEPMIASDIRRDDPGGVFGSYGQVLMQGIGAEGIKPIKAKTPQDIPWRERACRAKVQFV